MVEPDEIFNLWGIVSNEIIGDVWLTIFLFAVGMMYLTVRLKMPFEMQLIFLFLIMAAIFSKTLILIIWVFSVLIVGSIAYWIVTKALS